VGEFEICLNSIGGFQNSRSTFVTHDTISSCDLINLSLMLDMKVDPQVILPYAQQIRSRCIDGFVPRYC
jgi:hypothetical protein